MTERRELALALLLELAGAALVLLAAGRTWVSLSARRPGLVPLHLDVSGRSIDASPFALALAAFAGLVAVLATKGRVRQGVGGLVALIGAAAIWRGIAASGALSIGRERDLIEQHQRGAVLADAVVRSTVHGQWSVVTALGGALVLLAGLIVAVRGARWAGLARRYETPAAQQPVDPAPAGEDGPAADLAMWKALDRGDDPTT